jgi:hypothetical protein
MVEKTHLVDIQAKRTDSAADGGIHRAQEFKPLSIKSQ